MFYTSYLFQNLSFYHSVKQFLLLEYSATQNSSVAAFFPICGARGICQPRRAGGHFPGDTQGFPVAHKPSPMSPGRLRWGLHNSPDMIHISFNKNMTGRSWNNGRSINVNMSGVLWTAKPASARECL